MEEDRPEAVAARQRQAAMVDELRKTELVRDRLEGLQQLVGSYPEGHDTRVLLEELHLERALRAVSGGHRGPSGVPPLPWWYLRSCRPSHNTTGRVPYLLQENIRKHPFPEGGWIEHDDTPLPGARFSFSNVCYNARASRCTSK